jgi:hypothetical protein
MDVSRKIEEVEIFKYIYALIASSNINERAKKEILEKVDWELYYVKRNVVLALGENEYDRLCAIEERNKK